MKHRLLLPLLLGTTLFFLSACSLPYWVQRLTGMPSVEQQESTAPLTSQSLIDMKAWRQADFFDKKTLIVDATIDQLPATVVTSMETFINQFDLSPEQKTEARLLYLYPSGFIVPDKTGLTPELMDVLLLNHYTAWDFLYPANYPAKTYFNAQYNFSATYPQGWRLGFLTYNVPIFFSPSSYWDPNKGIFIPDEAFNVYIYRDCEGKTLEQVKNDKLNDSFRQWPAQRIGGPETITPFLQWPNAERYRFQVDPLWFQDFDKAALAGSGDFFIEDYFLTWQGVAYRMSFKYFESQDATYRADAESILSSLAVDHATCAAESLDLGATINAFLNANEYPSQFIRSLAETAQ